MIVPRIKLLNPIHTIGLKKRTSLDQKDIVALWKTFMPNLKSINSRIGHDLIALQDYRNFDIQNLNGQFDIWALARVEEGAIAPDIFEYYKIPSGKYAVFLLKGMDAQGLMKKIMTHWLPNSNYEIDQERPHFQIMGAKYKNNHPDSEEDFYIPIISKNT